MGNKIESQKISLRKGKIIKSGLKALDFLEKNLIIYLIKEVKI